VVRDGLVIGEFQCSEYDLAGFRFWIPRGLETFELIFFVEVEGGFIHFI
jgi:hypothetical protein